MTCVRPTANPLAQHDTTVVSMGLSNDGPLLKRRFFAVKHCPTTTRWSNGETLLVNAQEEGGYNSRQVAQGIDLTLMPRIYKGGAEGYPGFWGSAPTLWWGHSHRPLCVR